MNNASPEQVQASMQKWIEWKDALDSSMNFEWGMPLQTKGVVTRDSISDGASDISGYAIIEGEEAAVLEILKTHPHQQIDGASIQLLQMLPLTSN